MRKKPTATLKCLCRRFGFRCQNCGTRVRLPRKDSSHPLLFADTATRQHVIPKGLGGTNWDNISLWCKKCNEEDGLLISGFLAGKYDDILGDNVTNTEIDAHMAAIVKSPSDALAKQVLADRLDEAGEWPELSYALRWCAAYGKSPEQGIDPNPYSGNGQKEGFLWKRSSAKYGHGANPSALPQLVRRRIEYNRHDNPFYLTPTEAFEAVGIALSEILSIVELPRS